jgi:class 3 adenylate cyclase
MKNNRKTIKIGEKSMFAPGFIFLWLATIVMPSLIGGYFFKQHLNSSFNQKINKITTQLTANAEKSTTFLNPERIFRDLMHISKTTSAFKEYFPNDRKRKNFIENPVVENFPNSGKITRADLKKYSRFLSDHTAIKPAFLACASINAKDCLLQINHSFSTDKLRERQLKGEFAEMALRLQKKFKNEGFNFKIKLKQIKPHVFPAFFKFLGAVNEIKMDCWQIDSGFSYLLNSRFFLYFLSSPWQKQPDQFIVLGYSENHLPVKAALKSFIKTHSSKSIKVSFGHSRAEKLPSIYRQNENINLLYELPYDFLKIYKNQYKFNPENNPVLKFSYALSKDLKELKKQLSFINLGIFVFVSGSLLLILKIILTGSCFQQSIQKCITAGFISTNLLAITGFFWLSIAFARHYEESQLDRAIALTKSKIKQIEIDIKLARLKQIMLIRYFSYKFENLPGKYFKKYIPLIDPENSQDYIRRFLYTNFLLVDKQNHHFMRDDSQSDKDTEIKHLLVGDSVKTMLNTGAFASLSLKRRNEIAQSADITQGLTEQVVDKKLINKIFADEGSFDSPATIALNKFMCSNILRGSEGVKGIFSCVTNDTTLQYSLEQLMREKAMITRHKEENIKIEISLFPVNKFENRSLGGKLEADKGFRRFNLDKEYDTASGIFSHSESGIIQNKNNNQIELFIGDTIFAKHIFILARCSFPASKKIYFYLFAILALLITLSACSAIAIGTGQILLAEIQPFKKAINRLKKDNFDWQIEINSGDEFEKLAGSFNHMTIKMQERNKLRQLVSKNAIEAVSGEKENIDISPKKRQATILFSDIRSFTTLTEKYSGEEIVSMLNQYLGLMSKAIEDNDGFVDKIIGDAIQAVFYGNDKSTRLKNCFSAALAMRKNLKQFNHKREQKQLFTINNGIGISDGSVMTGLVGSQRGKLDSAIFGNPVIEAEYLESQSKHAQNSQILVSKNDAEEISEIQTQEFRLENGEAALELLSLKI